MKNSSVSLLLITCCIAVLILFSSCSSRYIESVSADAKTEFGITLIAPSQGIFFVQNEKVNAAEGVIELHTKEANSIYNMYGPATDKIFVGRTNARQLKFSMPDKTYLIDITKFKKRTAMILFIGKGKPIIIYNAKRYKSVVEHYFGE